MFSETFATLFAIFFFVYVFNSFSKRRGPILWPLLGIIPTLLFHLHDSYHWITNSLIQTGGSFYYRGVSFIGSHGIITARPSHIQFILKTKFLSFPKGPYFQERFQELLGNGIFNADGEEWKRQRGAAMAEMHTRGFKERSVEAAKWMIEEKLMRVLDGYAVSGKPIDLQDILLRFTFDNICLLALGVDLGCLTPDLPHIPFAKAFEEATHLSLLRFILPPFIWKPMRFFQIGWEGRLKAATEVVHSMAEEAVRERRREQRERSNSSSSGFDLLSIFMDKYDFSDKELKDLCISFILAGRDTSSVGLAWLFWLVHGHPRVEEKILKEIREEEGLEKKMVYLEAAIQEAMRLYPPVPMDMKEAAEEDVVFPDGTGVGKGERVMYSIFSMGRMASVWGEDCAEFKPERWLVAAEEEEEEEENCGGGFSVRKESQFKYPIFNAGPRLCVGRGFACMQMKMVAAFVLGRYSFEVVEGCRVVPKMTTTLYMKNGLYVTLKHRLS